MMMLLKRTVQTVLKPLSLIPQKMQVIPNFLQSKSMVTVPLESFSFKQFPKMFKTKYEKGRLNCRFRTKNTSWKRGFKRVQKVHVQNGHNSLLKRIRIVGPAYDRKLKFKSANHRHQLRKKSRACLARKRRPRYAHSTDFKRLRKLIPLLKTSTYKANH